MLKSKVTNIAIHVKGLIIVKQRIAHQTRASAAFQLGKIPGGRPTRPTCISLMPSGDACRAGHTPSRMEAPTS